MKILLLDAYNLIHRARSGYTKGDNAVVYNFFRGVRPIIEKFNADKVYFVLEGYPKHRVDLADDYKAGRIDPGDTFRQQKDVIIDVVKRCLPFVSVRHPDFECDDVIATIAVNHATKGDECIIVSSDSDFIQLHNIIDVKLYHPIKKCFIDKPDYDYVMWKALRGDKTDNIPGIKGVGDKTALKLVKDSEKLANYLKVEENLKIFERNVNLIRLVNLSGQEHEFEAKRGEFNPEILKETFSTFEFSSIISDKPWKKYCQTFEGLQSH